jgi:hypothetical protein
MYWNEFNEICLRDAQVELHHLQVVVSGDVRFEFCHQRMRDRKLKVFCSFSVNTAFIKVQPTRISSCFFFVLMPVH